MNNNIKLSILVLSSIIICIASPFIGISFISIDKIINNAFNSEIFFTMRIPRVMTAFLAGGGLSLAGMVFQAVFHNPLAAPFTLGVASGASFGAAIMMLIGFSFGFLGTSIVSLGSFLGAIIAVSMVYGFSTLKRDTSSLTLLLSGIAVSFIFSSLLMFCQFLSDLRHSFQIVRWLMGGIEVFGYEHFIWLIPSLLIGIAAIILHLPHLDQILSGEEIAQSRGVDVKKTKIFLIFSTSLMVGGIVSVCGPIGFVGIMLPHICRQIFGIKHKILGFSSFLSGGIFLVICDTIARTLVAPFEIPVGVFTAMLGGPFFLWILFGKRESIF